MRAKRFQKVLILNRGEIACRLIQTCQELGLKTVALYSEADKGSRHQELADEAIALAGSASKDTYLNLETIIPQAKKLGCDAVHPGYGFLSERAAAAEAFLAAGIEWIGPRPEQIRLLGDKLEAKKLLEKVRVPTAPWGEVQLSNPAALQELAKKIGFPVILKAASGGGGKGMRLVHSEAELMNAAKAAMAEAQASFGDGTVFLEKYVKDPRHIEIQILGDHHGEILHFGERECSLQRRHQKVIEEAPAPNLSEKAKSEIADCAVRLAKSVGYGNAGTVEFMVDADEKFYFLEVNSRLQVEHSVTEAVWGIDLVRAQIQIAQGAKLRDLFPGIRAPRGHAMQARIYAEDPANQFAPCPGLLPTVEWPLAVGVRIDTGVRSGSEVSLNYDAMLAKITASAENREATIQRLLWALRHTVIFGSITNINYLQDVLCTQEFQAGKVHVKFLETKLAAWADPVPKELSTQLPELLGKAANASLQGSGKNTLPSPWESL